MPTSRRKLLKSLALAPIAFGAAAVLGSKLSTTVEADGPKIKVDADKKNIVRKPDQQIDPENPPEGKPPGEDGFTDCQVTCHCRVPEGGADAKIVERDQHGQGCTVEVTVKQVDVTVGLEITVFLPPAPGDDASAEEKKAFAVLKAHEEGHVKICREVFELVAKKITEDVFKDFPKTFKVHVDACTEEEIKKKVDESFNAHCKSLCEELAKRIGAELEKAGTAYDDATTHGTKGPKKGKPGETEPATEENQGAAADAAIKGFKKDYEKPKK